MENKPGTTIEINKGNPKLLLEIDNTRRSIQERVEEISALSGHLEQLQRWYKTGKFSGGTK